MLRGAGHSAHHIRPSTTTTTRQLRQRPVNYNDDPSAPTTAL
ncbi:hypothetical protein O1L68_00910 [Streptomyces lydicus]|nr:hypothetical protein [Streptomyces lydicus]